MNKSRPAGMSGRQWTKLRKRQRRCEHERQITPEGQYTQFKCLDCGFVGDVPQPAKTDVIATDTPVSQTEG